MRLRSATFLGAISVAAVACNGVAFALPRHAALATASAGWTLAGLAAVAGLVAGLPRAASDFRRSWTMLLVGSIFWLLGELAWDVYVAVGKTPPSPSVGDAGWFLFAIFAAVGVYRFARPHGVVRRIVRLDALAMVAASSAALVALLHNEYDASRVSLAAKATALAYPLLYVGFAAVLAEAIARYPSVLRSRGLAVVFVGATVQAVGFTWWSVQLFDGSYVAGRSAVDLLWTIGELAIGAGGFLAATRNLPLRPAEQVLRYRSPLPALAFLALLGILVAGAAGAFHRWELESRLALQTGLFCVGTALFVRAWTMSRLWMQTLERERHARAAVERTNRELEAFSYGASHDLKAPLVSIQGFASSLEQRAADALDDRSRLYLQRIESNAVSLQLLIDELLEFARLGSDTPESSADADAIAREVVQGFRERYAERGANVELVSRLPSVQVHPTRFRQALTNLIENALVHAGTDAPHVQVAAFVRDGEVAVVVEDDGNGVRAGEEERIFDLFARGSSAGTVADANGRSGTGIGLALVKKVAETSGGSIAYEPGPAGGSRFVLSLPRGAQP